ncbi:MAG: DUF5611 family protein [Methanomassiliicoccales archaeon]
MDYDIKKGNYAKLEGDGLKQMMEEAFGKITTEGDLLVASYGALARLEVKAVSKTVLYVATKMDPKVPEPVAVDTMKKYYGFLEKATGFTTKERGKRAQAKVKKGDA